MNPVHHSSKTQRWETPPEVFDPLNKEFEFTLDPCCTPGTAKCARYFTETDDGLARCWSGETVFCNPPYGRQMKHWIKKCHDEHTKHSITVVMLIPVRTDTAYFHDYIYGIAELRFMRSRPYFLLNGVRAKSNAPFPVMIVIFKTK